MNFSDHKNALKLLAACQDAESDFREHSEECHIHVSLPNGQWEEKWWSQQEGSPRYTYDVTTPIVDQIAADVAEADFAIRANPLGGGADKDIAAIYDGIIRNIQKKSGAEHIFNNVSKNTIIGGIDGCRVVSKYLSDESFDQDLTIEPIHNYRQRVWHDLASVEVDKADARYCFVLHSPLVEDYEERWPEGKKQSVSDGSESTALTQTKDVVIVGEMLYEKHETVEIVLMTDGRVLANDEKYQAVADELALLRITEEKRRKIKRKVWYSRFFDNADWLGDEKKTPFKSCPVVPEYANYAVIENQQVYRGEVSRLLDPARNLNYTLSREMAEGALAPRAKYWMTLKQAEGALVKQGLETLNTNQSPVQFYNFDPNVPNPPQQQGGAQINPGLRTMSEAMLAIVGHVANRFQAAMGNNPGLQSGVAIDRLQDRSNMAGFKYLQSHSIMLRRVGRVMQEAIPTVYDKSRRVVQILNEDGTQEEKVLNETIIDQQTGRPVVINDLSRGMYEIVCEAGSSFKNRLEQTITFILEMSKTDPSILSIGGDLLMNSMTFPAAKELAERKRALMLKQGVIPAKQMTEEEKQEAQANSQNQPQDPAMVLAMAEMKKAEAEAMLAQVKIEELRLQEMELQIKLADSAQKNDIAAGKLSVDEFNAETNRFKVQLEAEESGSKAPLTELQIESASLDNARKIKEIITPKTMQ